MIADEYEVPIGPGAPPGEYLIEIGMYATSIGERLEVKEKVDGKVLLEKIQVPRGDS